MPTPPSLCLLSVLSLLTLGCSSGPEMHSPCDGATPCDAGDAGDSRDADAPDTGTPADVGPEPDAAVMVPGGEVVLVAARMTAPRMVELVFSGVVTGSNAGFALYGTRSNAFDTLVGFGTTTLVGATDRDVVYGEIITVSYDEGPGDLAGVRWFRKELVDNELPYVGGASGAGRELYVAAAATGSGDGTRASPYAPSQLTTSTVRAGDRINIEAGTYREGLPVPRSGTPGDPIVYEGYRDAPGDTRHRAAYPVPWTPLSAAEMPLFVGSNRGAGYFCQLRSGKHDLVFRNLQARNFRWGVGAADSEPAYDLYFDNVALENLGTDTAGGSGFLLAQNVAAGTAGAETIRAMHVINSYVLNATQQNYWVDGDDSFMYENRSYSNDNRNHEWDTDYMFVAYFGHDMVWRRLYLEKGPSPAHAGHGLTLKATSAMLPIENTLIDDCEAVNINGSVEFRHSAVRNNLVRNIRVDGNGGGPRSGALIFRDGASFNTVDGCDAFDLHDTYNGAITFLDTREDGGYSQLMEENVVRNCVFRATAGAAIRLGSADASPVLMRNNHILNNTFVGAVSQLRISAVTDNENLVLTNNIFQDIPDQVRNDDTVDVAETHNAYFNFWGAPGTAPPGTGNVSVHPAFEDAPGHDFRLTAASPLINAGADVATVRYDRVGMARTPGRYSIGAYERD